MSDVETLLPANATKLERVLEQATSRVGTVPIKYRDIWNPQTCPERMLPWLAYALGVEEWDSEWPVAYKRQLIEETRTIRRTKGTPASVKNALASLGHSNAKVIERYGYVRYDGRVKYDGRYVHGGAKSWATFAVILMRPVTVKQALLIRSKINSVKRNCVHLVRLDFSSVAIRYDGSMRYDGEYTHGMV